MNRLRYLIMPAAAATVQQRQVALSLNMEPIEFGSLTVYVAKGSETLVQRCDGAILIGRIFPRAPFGPPRRPATLVDGDFTSERIFQAFWGDYIFVESSGADVLAYRSPSGKMPAYYASSTGGLAIASDCDLLIAIALVSGAIAWEECARQLMHTEQLLEQTALEGVRELLPGSSIALTETKTPQCPWWCPWDIGDTASHKSIEQSALELGRLVTDCVQAQVEGVDRILVRVSGGLDSSIVAASLARQDQRVQLMVLVAGEGDGDERHYARMLAQHLGRHLHEVRYGIEDVDLDCASFPELPVPRGRHMAQSIHHISSRIVGDGSNSAILTGYGGDNLFCSLMSVRPIVDRLFANGLLGAGRTLHDVGRATDSSITETFSKTVRFLAGGRRRYRPNANSMFLHPDFAVGPGAPPMHPTRPEMPKPLPGKDMHLAMILGALRYVDHQTGPIGAAEIAPLIAQPILDYCLGIPSWVWCAHGLDRSIARRAFDDRLPPAIARRRSKGGPDAFGYRIVEQRRNHLRERLLDGALVRHGILDRKAVEHSLSDDRPLASVATSRLLQLSDAEAWARARIDRARPEMPPTAAASPSTD